jgi:RNA polymerase sigma-70 factor (ECF subfamily)
MEAAQDLVQHMPRLRRYARALTGDRARADDLVQDTLERALAKLHLWRPGSDLRAWLFTVMHNVHVNQRRAQGDHVMVDAETVEIPVRPTQTDAIELRDLSEMLARLPEAQREVLLLVALEGMAYEEVARTLGIPIGTVMSRLSRARERLRELIAGGSPTATATLRVVK